MNANDMLPYGLGNPDLVEAQEGYFVDRAIVDDLNKLTNTCREAGFELRIESAYRPFEKQLSIWNRKARGELQLLDANGEPMQRPADEEELMYAILTWSALPGASRHHLGTDIDVVDGGACPPGYEVQLTPAECTGICLSFSGMDLMNWKASWMVAFPGSAPITALFTAAEKPHSARRNSL